MRTMGRPTRPTYRLHQELIGLRRRHPWLHAARTRKVHLTNEQYAFETTDGTGRLTVCLNIGAESAEFPVNGGIRVEPHSYRILDM